MQTEGGGTDEGKADEHEAGGCEGRGRSKVDGEADSKARQKRRGEAGEADGGRQVEEDSG